MLAGVRNGSGIIPICDPKGVPEDASEEYLDQVDKWGIDGHSHSYLTVEELLNYKWNELTSLEQWIVNGEQYKVFKETGRPKYMCKWAGGPNVVHVSQDEMEKLIREGKNTEHVYCPVEWKEPYAESSKFFIEVTIPELRKLGKDDEVRIVFFFDN